MTDKEWKLNKAQGWGFMKLKDQVMEVRNPNSDYVIIAEAPFTGDSASRQWRIGYGDIRLFWEKIGTGTI